MSEVDRYIGMAHKSNTKAINQKFSNKIKNLIKMSYK